MDIARSIVGVSDMPIVCNSVEGSFKKPQYKRACGQKVGHQNLTHPGDFAHKHMNCRL